MEHNENTPETSAMSNTRAPNESHLSRTRGSIVVVVVLMVILGMIFFFSFAPSQQPTTTTENATTTASGIENAFADVRLEGRAAYVYDIREDRELFSKNGNTTLPIASITKVMTALVAHKHISAKHEVVISSSALATEGESGLILGERWDLKELIDFVLVTSSNDGASALRESYEATTGGSFIAAMNNTARIIGLEKTLYVNETGLDEGWGRETNAGSPRDMALLFAHTLRTAPSLFESTRHDSQTFTSLSGNVHSVSNTNRLANDIPWSVGAKTGFTDSAGGNLAIAFDVSVGRPIVIVVMGSSREGRFTDMRKLIEATLRSVKLSSDN